MSTDIHRSSINDVKSCWKFLQLSTSFIENISNVRNHLRQKKHNANVIRHIIIPHRKFYAFHWSNCDHMALSHMHCSPLTDLAMGYCRGILSICPSASEDTRSRITETPEHYSDCLANINMPRLCDWQFGKRWLVPRFANVQYRLRCGQREPGNADVYKLSKMDAGSKRIVCIVL